MKKYSNNISTMFSIDIYNDISDNRSNNIIPNKVSFNVIRNNVDVGNFYLG